MEDSDDELGEHQSGLPMDEYGDVMRGGGKQPSLALPSKSISSSSASAARRPSSSSFSAYQHYSHPLPRQLPSHPLPTNSGFTALPFPPPLPSSATHCYASSSSSISSGSTSGYSTASSSPQYTPRTLPPPSFSAFGAGPHARRGSGVRGSAYRSAGVTRCREPEEGAVEAWEDEGRERWPKEVTRMPWNYKGQ